MHPARSILSDTLDRRLQLGQPSKPTWIVAIAASAGGIRAIEAVLGGLPAKFPAAVLVLQHMERRRLRQVLVNLLANAFKFTDDGAVSVSVRRTDSDAYFTVSDTGIGIAEDDVPHVFDAFWRANKSNDPRRTGMGLGLAVSRRLAQSLNGELGVQSQVGIGTMFTLRLPIQSEF